MRSLRSCETSRMELIDRRGKAAEAQKGLGKRQDLAGSFWGERQGNKVSSNRGKRVSVLVNRELPTVEAVAGCAGCAGHCWECAGCVQGMCRACIWGVQGCVVCVQYVYRGCPGLCSVCASVQGMRRGCAGHVQNMCRA